MISSKGDVLRVFTAFRFKFNRLEILAVAKRLYLTKFKEACTHKERKYKEEMERVRERKFQSFKLIDSAIA